MQDPPPWEIPLAVWCEVVQYACLLAARPWDVELCHENFCQTLPHPLAMWPQRDQSAQASVGRLPRWSITLMWWDWTELAAFRRRWFTGQVSVA